MLIHSLNAARIDTSEVLKLILESAVGEPLLNVGLAAYTHHLDEPISHTVRRQLADRLWQLFQMPQDPETHALADLLLRKMNIDPLAKFTATGTDRQLTKGCNWYINKAGICMIIIRPEQLTDSVPAFAAGAPDHQFAISATEVTHAQLSNLVPEFNPGEQDEGRSDDLPAGSVGFEHAAMDCQKLNTLCNVLEPEWCYQNKSVSGGAIWQPVEGYMSRLGHRLPTDEEWLYVCRCGTNSRLSFGNDSSYLKYYGWCMPWSTGRRHPVAALLPNRLGIFDFYGNVNEICFTSSGASGEYSVRGGNYFAREETVRTDSSARFLPGSQGVQNGFRIVHTVRP